MTDTAVDAPERAVGGEHSRLARAGVLIAAGGLVSRSLGWVRIVIIAAIFGASPELDAYFAAFRIPDAVFQLVAGGVLSSVLIPLIAQRGREDPPAAWRTVSGFTNVLLIAVAVLSVSAAIAAPWLVPLIAPGFDERQLATAVDLTRIMLISPICFALGAVAASVLHSQDRFAAAAAAPIAYNLAIIISALALSTQMGVMALAVGVAVGAVCYLLLQLIPLLLRTSYRHRLTGIGEPGVGQAIALLAPRSLGLAGTQLIFIVNTALASTLGSGAVTAYTISFTLLMIPVGLVGVPLGIVLFPSLSRAAAAESVEHFGRVLLQALRFTLWAAALLTALGVVLHEPVVQLLFGHGQLDSATLRTIAATTVVLFAGIGAHSVNLVAARAFYARQDTRTPVVLTLIQVAITVALAGGTYEVLGLPGLALAVAVGSWSKAIAMLVILSARLGVLDGTALLRAAGAFALAGLLAGAVTALAALVIGGQVAGLPATVGHAVTLLIGGTAGTATYLIVAAVLRLPELRRSLQLARLALRRE